MNEDKPEATGTDMNQEEIETLYDVARQDALDEIAETLDHEGFDPDEIDETLYADDNTDAYMPRRRRGRRHRRRSQRYDMYAAPRRRRSRRSRARRYDPAPRRRRHSRRRRYDPAPRRTRKSRGILRQFLDNIGIITFGGKFLLDYQARAQALGTNPGTSKPYTLIEALTYDIQNFKMADATTRVTKALPTVAIEVIGGVAARSSRVNSLLKGYGKPLGDALVALGAETIVKAALDPPVEGSRPCAARQQSCQTGEVSILRKTAIEQPVDEMLPYGA